MNHPGEPLPVGFPVALVPAVARPKRLAIVGSHPATRELAPYDDPDYEIWLFNESAQKPEVYRRWDALIQIHSPEVYTSPDNWVNKEHWTWLQQDHGYSTITGRRKQIFMQAADPRVPNSVEYPLDEVLKLTPYRYLRSSPALALALALYLNRWASIDLYGSELTSNTEYGYQAPNYAFWIGFAHGLGVDLRLKCWQNEFFQPIYGFDGEFDIDRAIFKERAEMHDKTWRTNESVLQKVRDRLDAAMLKNDYDKVAKLLEEAQDVALTDGESAGQLGEAERYAARTNPISRQEYERVSAQAQIDYNKILPQMYHAGGKCEYVWNVWRQNGNNAALNQLRAFTKERLQAAYDAGALKGAFIENIFYMQEYDRRLEAAGGIRALGR